MNSFRLSIWFGCCVGLGLLLAWLDGVRLQSILLAALVAAGIALILTVVRWLSNRG